MIEKAGDCQLFVMGCQLDIIGKKCKHIQASNVLDYIFGYTIANDITAPQFFREDGHWTIGKAFDTFPLVKPLSKRLQ